MKKLALAFGMSVAAGALAVSPALAQFKTQGVSDGEIVIGTHMDLSGPIKSWGIPSSNGAKLAVAQANAAGGSTFWFQVPTPRPATPRPVPPSQPQSD